MEIHITVYKPDVINFEQVMILVGHIINNQEIIEN